MLRDRRYSGTALFCRRDTGSHAGLPLRSEAGFVERALEEVGEVEVGSPVVQVSEVEGLGLDLEDAEDVAPLAVRDAAAGAVPGELVEDGVLGAAEVEGDRLSAV